MTTLDRMLQPASGRLPELTSREAVREVAWVARRARELTSDPEAFTDVLAQVEYYQRKARLMDHIGELELAEKAWEQEARWRAQLTGPLIPQG